MSADATVPSASDTDRFTLPKGKLQLNAMIEMNLSKDAAFKPVSIAPDLWYGVNDDVTIGLVHSGLGATGFIGNVGDSLCVTGSGNNCAHLYNNVGLDGRIRLKKPLALDVGLYITSIADPFQLAGKLGLDGRWNFGSISLEIQPSLFIGFTNRDPMTTGTAVIARNTETLYVPATVAYAISPKFDLALQAGVVLPFDNTSDAWRIPLSVAARVAATPRFGIGLAFTFPDLIGGTSTAESRSLTLGGTYAF